MDIAHSPAPTRRLLLPDAPALVAGARKAVWLTSDGEVETIDLGEARLRLQRDTLLVCHAKALGRRLNADRFTALDLLELFAFVHPARFVVPTPRGLAEALELPKPDGAEDDALTLIRATRQLLMDLTDPDFEEKSDPVAIAWFMGGGGGGNQGYCWPWASFVLSALGAPNGPPGRRALGAFQVWKAMPEWEEEPPEPPPGQLPVHANDARRRLADLLQASIQGKAAEPRPQQSDYASAVSTAFTPRANPGTPKPRAGGGRYGRRQDAGLSCPRQPMGGEEPGNGVDFHLYPQPSAPDRRRAGPAPHRSGGEVPQGGAAEGP